MIVCRTCGSRNADGDSFCGSCGDFLEWTGEKASDAGSPPPVEQEPAAPPAARRDEPPDEPTVTGRSDGDGETPGATAALVAPIPADPAPAPFPEPTPTAPTPTAEAAAPAPQAQPRAQPEAMMPQGARRRPAAEVTAPPPQRHPRPGDVICGNCGEGNLPTRRFCSRCGRSLQVEIDHSAAVVTLPWWRRLFHRRFRARPAGTRPSLRQARGTTTSLAHGVLVAVRRTLAIAVLLTGVLYALSPQTRDAVNHVVLGAKDRVQSLISPRYVPVRPTSAAATAEVPGHPAGAVTDGFTNTFWAAPDATAQPTLVLRFDHPVGLDRAIVRLGGGDDFQAWGRPEKLHLVYSTGRTFDLTLTDTPDPQDVTLAGGDGVTSVELHVVSVYRSVQSRGLAITEIELFQRQ